MGWRIEGGPPKNVNKYIMVAAPHTSNFDYIFAMATFYQLKLPVKYLIKREWLDNFLIGKMLKTSGAIGVNRSKSTTMVDALANLLTDSKENMALVVPAEGTRKLVHKWKTGFYYVALKAQVPLQLCYLDYPKKLAGMGPIFMPTGDFEKDMEILKDFYKDIVPRHPDRFSLDIYLPEDEEN